MAKKLYIGSTLLIDLTSYRLVEDSYTKAEVDSAIANVDVTSQLENYVQKDGNKVLSTNDFTDALKTKLEGLENFDPTDINAAIQTVKDEVAALVGGESDATAALDTFNEIKDFLAQYENTDSLVSVLSTTESNIKTWVSEQGFASAADVAGFYTKPEAGIPPSDMTAEVQDSLALADSAVQGDGVVKIVSLTTADYTALSTKDTKTIYIVND